MKRYIIRTVSTATELNKNFAGQTHTYYYGKGQELIAAYGTQDAYIDRNLAAWWIKEYGYSRICDAKRSWILNNPENSEWWNSTAEIVAVEVDGCSFMMEA